MSPAKNGPTIMVRTDSQAQVERWKAAAKRDGRSLADWIRRALDAAEESERRGQGEKDG